jgi:hypothetical protein
MLPSDKYARGLVKTLDVLFSPTMCAARAIRGTGNRKTAKRGTRAGIVLDELVGTWVDTGVLTAVHRANVQFMAVVQCLEANGLAPAATQVPVACTRLRVGTCVDLVCTNATGGTVLVELKCGFDDYYDVANQGTMSHPFRDFPATYRNKHLVQLLVTTYLYAHSRQDERLDGAVVLRVFSDPTGAIRTELSPLPLSLVLDQQRLVACLVVIGLTANQTSGQRSALLHYGSTLGHAA